MNLSWRYLTWSRGGGIIVGDDVPHRAQAVKAEESRAQAVQRAGRTPSGKAG